MVMIKGLLCLFLHKNVCCGFSLESLHCGDSNEYLESTFLWRNNKIILIIKTNAPYKLCFIALTKENRLQLLKMKISSKQ